MTLFILPVKVSLGSPSKVVGWQGAHLKIRLHAVAEKGQANQALRSFLADLFEVPLSQVVLVSGFSSPFKRFKIQIDDPTQLSKEANAIFQMAQVFCS